MARSLVVPPPPAESSDVSTQTVRERLDPASRSLPGPVPVPPDWPMELWRFPIRGLGTLRLGILLAVFAAVDALGEWNALIGWAVKLGALFYLLRYQIRIVSSSASGRNEVPSIGLEGTWEEFAKPVLGFSLAAAIVLAPALLTWLIPKLPMIEKSASPVVLALLVVVPLLYLPVVMLGAAMNDLSMKWPHRAIGWMLRGFLACGFVALGWVALFLAEVAIASTNGATTAGMLLHVTVRAAGLYLAVATARALGVLGRSYDAPPA